MARGETPPTRGVRESRRVRRKPVKYADWVNGEEEEGNSDDSEWSFDGSPGSEVHIYDDRSRNFKNFRVNMQPLSIGLLNFDCRLVVLGIII